MALENYIASRDGEMRAELIIGRITETISTLAYMPGLGTPRRYLEKGVLAFSIAPWLIVYTPLPDLDGVRVIRVVDSRRDLDATMKKEGSGR